MNKSKLKQIKSIMGYQGLPEQKRLLRRFKKSYSSLSVANKIRIIDDLKLKFSSNQKDSAK
jgi:hypothetical protein